MIWGGIGNFRNNFFPRELLPYRIFFLGKASQNLFFPHRGLSKFIFSSVRPLKISWRVPVKIYFSPEGTSQDLIFPGKCLSKIFFPEEYLSKLIFSLEKDLQIFFYRFPPPPPQIINGCPLIALTQSVCLSHVLLSPLNRWTSLTSCIDCCSGRYD